MSMLKACTVRMSPKYIKQPSYADLKAQRPGSSSMIVQYPSYSIINKNEVQRVLMNNRIYLTNFCFWEMATRFSCLGGVDPYANIHNSFARGKKLTAATP